ncbi:MAG: monovalent cation/H(+) antiporter subunit G [Clostridia bacterium]|nr:monovalent cation/H(+) antiporter subunit G [Clostridia bacterium]
MLEWIRFGTFTALIAAALILETMAVFGVNRFKYSLNRIHASAIGDTLAVMCVSFAAILYTGFSFLAVKFAFVILLVWLTSPMSGHLISLLVFRTDNNLDKEVKLWKN